MTELNEKLAKFAGFRYLPYKDVEGFGDGYIWVHPDWEYGNGKWNMDLPNFTDSLNACFEHIEPELYRRGLRYQLTRLQDGHMAEILEPSKGWADVVAYAVDEKPATAFCKAVEILMEKEGTDVV